MQTVLGTGPLETGLAFLPMALALGVGVHIGSQVIAHGGVRVPLAGALVVVAGGMLLLTGVDADGSYVADLLPGMLVAGLGLGVALVAVAVAVLTGAPTAGRAPRQTRSRARALEPLIERGQRDGQFRADVSPAWHLAMVLAIVHAASAALDAEHASPDAIERELIATVLGAVS